MFRTFRLSLSVILVARAGKVSTTGGDSGRSGQIHKTGEELTINKLFLTLEPSLLS